jgi:hypothetical protein
MMNATDIVALLANATPDTIVHIDYLAGRPANERAKQEFNQASDWKKSGTSYVGHFVGMKTNKWGELILTLFVHNRGEIGSYRSFNPNLGKVRAIRVVKPN